MGQWEPDVMRQDTVTDSRAAGEATHAEVAYSKRHTQRQHQKLRGGAKWDHHNRQLGTAAHSEQASETRRDTSSSRSEQQEARNMKPAQCPTGPARMRHKGNGGRGRRRGQEWQPFHRV